MNSGLLGLVSLLFLLQTGAARAEEALSPALEGFIDSLFAGVKLDLEGVTTLSSGQEPARFSLTQGGSNADAWKMHQSAVAMLSAVGRVQAANLTAAEKEIVMLRAYSPEHVCPKHTYDSYDCDEGKPYRTIDGSCNNLYVFLSWFCLACLLTRFQCLLTRFILSNQCLRCLYAY